LRQRRFERLFTIHGLFLAFLNKLELCCHDRSPLPTG
jgi:hypothetical protein